MAGGVAGTNVNGVVGVNVYGVPPLMAGGGANVNGVPVRETTGLGVAGCSHDGGKTTEYRQKRRRTAGPASSEAKKHPTARDSSLADGRLSRYGSREGTPRTVAERVTGQVRYPTHAGARGALLTPRASQTVVAASVPDRVTLGSHAHLPRRAVRPR
jgi:hypothetical protein